ncbi:MAG: DUF2388 domain-containing protein [Pseudomonas sp.]|uniref:DUF2388 domain-containing protein n=1 Tax=Pseudomonas sp. TaxID=306 RepID=UPI003D0DEAD0
MTTTRTLAIVMLLSASHAGGMEGQGNSVDHFTVASSLGTAGTSAATSNALPPYKVARDDALAFIASEGSIHGAQLESALRHYRHAHPQSGLSDMQLALSLASIR